MQAVTSFISLVTRNVFEGEKYVKRWTGDSEQLHFGLDLENLHLDHQLKTVGVTTVCVLIQYFQCSILIFIK